MVFALLTIYLYDISFEIISHEPARETNVGHVPSLI